MELMQSQDLEDARRIVDPVLKMMMDAVRRYDAYIVQSTGDSIFALVARRSHTKTTHSMPLM